MKRLIVLFICLFVFGGCSQARYLDELLTLKRIGDEQLSMANFVKEQNSKFDILLEDVKSGNISGYKTNKSLLSAFGQPIFAKKVNRDGGTQEKWLYRYSTDFFNSPKVVFYVDDKGNVESWEYIGPK